MKVLEGNLCKGELENIYVFSMASKTNFHCVVSLSKNINPSLVLVQPRKTRPFITERMLMGRKESNQTNKIKLITWLEMWLGKDVWVGG